VKAASWTWIERAQAALPLLGLAAVAGFTWWLVQSSGERVTRASAPLTPDTADVELEEARVLRVGPDGRLQAVLTGERIRHLPVQERLLVERLSLSALDEAGRRVQAEALRGQADERAEQVTLSGVARVVLTPASDAGSVSAPPTRVEGEELVVTLPTRTVRSDQPVVVMQGDNELHARAFVHDGRQGVTELSGRVTGRLMPQP
jgi:lipopolysaccharide export system protein LptC